VSGHAFQNACYLNTPPLRQVMLFKMAAIWMHLYCARSHFSKCQSFECSSIVSGHAFQNACHLNAPLLCQVMLFKMPAIWMQPSLSSRRTTQISIPATIPAYNSVWMFFQNMYTISASQDRTLFQVTVIILLCASLDIINKLL
jgi:hypothetical protein